MASNIDPTAPQTGIDQPVSVIRNNFARAKIEIEALQSTKLNKSSDAMTGVLTLANVSIAALPTASLTRGGILYDTDRKTLVYSDGTNWVPQPKNLQDLSNVAVGIPGPTEDGYALSWDDSSKKFILAPAPGSGTVTSINITPTTGIVSIGGPIVTAGSITIGLDFLNPSLVTPAVGDRILIRDATDNQIKTIDVIDLINASSGLTDIVDDLTPQLGGNLDVNGKSIVSVSNGDININPNGSGRIILDGLAWPPVSGASGHVLMTDGVSTLSFTSVLKNVIEDSSPELGGALNAQSFQIKNMADPTDPQDAVTTAWILNGADGNIKIENGFDNRIDTILSFNNISREFTITPTGPSFSFWSNGKKYIKNAPQSIIIPDIEGLHYFYFDINGVLQTTQIFSPTFITRDCWASLVYWDATNNKTILIGDERHGRTMDSEVHSYLHNTLGTRYDEGLGLGNIDADASGNLDSDAQISIADGIIRDEDIRFVISNNLPQTLSPIAEIPLIYRVGVDPGVWRKIDATQFPITTTGGSNRAAWNNPNAGGPGVWGLSEVSNNSFVLMHIFATTSIEEPIFAIIGQNEYITLTAAQDAALSEVNNLSFGPLQSFAVEFKAIATLIFETSNSYTNSVKSRIRTTSTGGEFIDFRTSDLGAPQTGTTVNDHGSLLGLIDDDHTQYLLTNGSRLLSGDFNFNFKNAINVGNINGIDITTLLSDIVDDLTPQLGGNLDVNGKSIISTSNGDIILSPHGTGQVILDGLSWPATDGSINQIIKTDGAGNLSFTNVHRNIYINGNFDDVLSGSSMTIIRYPISIPLTLPIIPLDGAQHAAILEIAPTATTAMTIWKLSSGIYTQIGTITFTATAAPVIGTINIISNTTFNINDCLFVRSPVVPDATAGQFGCTLVGYRT